MWEAVSLLYPHQGCSTVCSHSNTFVPTKIFIPMNLSNLEKINPHTILLSHWIAKEIMLNNLSCVLVWIIKIDKKLYALFLMSVVFLQIFWASGIIVKFHCVNGYKNLCYFNHSLLLTIAYKYIWEVSQPFYLHSFGFCAYIYHLKRSKGGFSISMFFLCC